MPNRQTKCASVVATFKSSVQNDPDDNYMYLQPELDPSSCTDDSGFTDELELRVLRQIATKTGPLLEGEDCVINYYQQCCMYPGPMSNSFVPPLLIIYV